jgi:hypothetical protein
LALDFALSLLPFYFKHFILTYSFSQIEKKKTIEKKNAKKEGSLPSKFHSAHSLLAHAFGFLFLPFRFKRFLLGIFFISNIRKKRKTKRKKNHREEKKWRERRELIFFLLLLHLG